MFKNYLNTALRNLWRNRLFSIINVFGLALGLTVTIIILLYVQNELSYDQFHDNGDRIYRVLRVSQIDNSGYDIGVTSGPYGPALVNDFPGTVKDFTRVMPGNGLVTVGERAFIEDKFYFADENFFDVFSYTLAVGDPATALANPNNVILTKEMARKYFGDSDPMGQLLSVDNRYEFTVSGIMNDPPGRSHIDFDFLAALSIFQSSGWFSNWWNNGMLTYVLIDTPAEVAQVASQSDTFMDKYFAKDFARTGNRVGITLQPLSEIYFHKDVRYDFALHGDKNSVYIFFAIAIFIMLIACMNYMNLTTARASRRAREIGVRKVLGAFRSRLVFQFLAESFLMTLMAIVAAMAAVELLLPSFNSAFHLTLEVDFFQPQMLALLGGLLLLVSVLAGSYPAFLLSSFKPVKVLKSRRDHRSADKQIRKGLVVFQFSISVFLIIATLLINEQLSFIRSQTPTLQDEQVVLTRLVSRELFERQEDFANRLKTEGNVLNVSLMSGEPGGFHDAMAHDIEGKDDPIRLRTVFTDFDYVKTFGLEIVAGRDFSREFGTDKESAVLLNETAVKTLGWSNEEALGKTVSNAMMDTVKQQVVGIVKDYHYSSLKDKIEPLIISQGGWGRMVGIKIKSADLSNTIAGIERHWKDVSPEYPFDFTFWDESFNLLYQQEQTESTLFSIFSFISILIGCLGIFALASFAAEERTREIGIRKVLGASVPGLVQLLSVDFLKLIAIGNLIAWPLAWFAMGRWLENFAYRIDIGIWVFILAGALALLIAMLTVSWQAIKAALSNPVTALRYE